MADWIPGISQVKSLVQLVVGDVEGAAKTQENFIKQCPVVSQGVALGLLIAGEEKKAEEVFKEGVGTISNVLDSVPVLGHAKGAIHLIAGDEEGGKRALNAATRTSVVVGTGVVAGITTGGLAAIPAGIAAGATYDAVDTLIEDKPAGIYAAIDNAIKNPSAGNIFDATLVPVGDALAGYSGGQLGKQLKAKFTAQQRLQANANALNALENQRMALLEKLEAGQAYNGGTMTTGEATSLGNQITALTKKINFIEKGTTTFWYDAKTAQVTRGRPLGYIPQNHEEVEIIGDISEDLSDEDIREIARIQETGFQHDAYAEDRETFSVSEKRQKSQEYAHQKAKNDLKNAYRNVKQIKNLERSLENLDKDRDPNSVNEEDEKDFESFRNVWLHVQMYPSSNFTTAAMLNSYSQGVLHTFIRHADQWRQAIPEIQRLWPQLSIIQDQIMRVFRARNQREATIEMANLINALSDLSPEENARILKLFQKIQLLIGRYLKNIALSERNYLGTGFNNTRGLPQMYFKVIVNGEAQIMVFGVSDILYLPFQEFYPDRRPVRTITTIYFRKYDEAWLEKNVFLR